METLEFLVIGRILGQCVMVHKDDLASFSDYSVKLELNCVVVDLLTGKLSEPITIQQLIDVCPFNEVTSTREMSIMSDVYSAAS